MLPRGFGGRNRITENGQTDRTDQTDRPDASPSGLQRKVSDWRTRDCDYKLKEEDTHMLAGCSFRATHRKGC